jgi:hypothetical protein
VLITGAASDLDAATARAVMARVRVAGSSLATTVSFPRRLARTDEYAQLVVVLTEHDCTNGDRILMDGALRMSPQ